MDIQLHFTAKGIPSFSTLPDERKRSDTLLFLIIFVMTVSLTPILVLGGVALSFSLVLSVLAALTSAALVVRWPGVGLFVVAGCVLLVEQFPLPVAGSGPTLYIFYWPTNLTGLFERPIGFFIILVFLVFVCHNLLKRQKPLRGGALLMPFLFYLLCVAAGVLYGLASGGSLKVTVEEVRPFWYLFVSYLLAYNLVRQKKHLYFLFWLVILCAGVKGLQGVYIYQVLLHGSLVNHHEIMAHEESFFLVALLLLIILFSLHYCYRPQFFTALFILPFVLIALIANQRRADFVALLGGAAVVWVLIFMIKPRARKALVVILLVVLVLGGAYVATYASGSGGFSEPARAIVSVFHPDPNDPAAAASNLYRFMENYDLKYTVRENPMGLGFGKPFLEPFLLPNLSATDPVYLFVPHNTIYWVWMRLGPIGYFALWYLFGAIIVRGCIIERQLRDRYLQLVAIYIVAITFMEITVAFADYQLYFYRNVIYLGLMAGILMKLPSLDEEKKGTCR